MVGFWTDSSARENKTLLCQKCVSAISPEASDTDVCTSIWLSIGGVAAERLTREGQQWRLHLNVVVHLPHTLGQEVGGVIMAHLDKPSKLADLRNGER